MKDSSGQNANSKSPLRRRVPAIGQNFQPPNQAAAASYLEQYKHAKALKGNIFV